MSTGSGGVRDAVRVVADRLRRVYGRPVVPRLSPLDALIGTVLSQHTTDHTSHRAFHELRRQFPRWADAAHAPLDAIAAAIRESGLARVKAARIRGILRALARRFGRPTLAPLRRMPGERAMEMLTSLPGVGPKTAACVLLFGFGRDVCPVDTHVHRLARRLGWVRRTASAAAAQEWIAAHAPRGRAGELHLNLIRHGREVCRAARPRCAQCPLARMCPSAHAIAPARLRSTAARARRIEPIAL